MKAKVQYLTIQLESYEEIINLRANLKHHIDKGCLTVSIDDPINKLYVLLDSLTVKELDKSKPQ